MNKVITALEARVDEERWDTLRSSYRALKEHRSALSPLQSFLVQATEDQKLWRIISIWESMEVLQRVRSSGVTPAGVQVFRAAGAKAVLSVFEAREEL